MQHGTEEATIKATMRSVCFRLKGSAHLSRSLVLTISAVLFLLPFWHLLCLIIPSLLAPLRRLFV